MTDILLRVNSEDDFVEKIKMAEQSLKSRAVKTDNEE